ncbi:hypothetical protein ACP3P8_18945 [Pseudomonas aeruginosa]
MRSRGYKVVSVADLVEGREWALDPCRSLTFSSTAVSYRSTSFWPWCRAPRR